MSSKRIKREAINLVTPDRPDSETDRLRKEVNHKNEVPPSTRLMQIISTLEEFVGKMQKSLSCGVCTELLYQPFNLTCGHVFCYGVCC
jgi:hypothetical protein